MDNVKDVTKSINQLKSYSAMLLIIFIAIIGMVVLYFIDPTLFNKSFATELVITFIIVSLISTIVRAIFNYNKNPDDSMLRHLEWHGHILWLNLPPLIGVYIISLLVIIVSLFGLVDYVNQTHQDSNLWLWTILTVILIYGVGSGVYLSNLRQHDNILLNLLPTSIKDVYNKRFLWTMGFVAIFILMGLFFVFSPVFLQEYAGFVGIGLIFMTMVVCGMTFMYQGFMANPALILSGQTNNSTPWLPTFIRGIYVLLGVVIIGMLMYFVSKYFITLINSKIDGGSATRYLIDILLVALVLFAAYKIAIASGITIVKIAMEHLFKLLLFIPHLLVNIGKYVGKTVMSNGLPSVSSIGTMNDIYILVALIMIFILYLVTIKYVKPAFQKEYHSQGGTQLINQPVKTTYLSNIAPSIKLTNSESFKYQYALSFWFYIDSFAPTTTGVLPIVSYGGNPSINYDATNNSLLFTVKQPTEQQINDIERDNDTNIGDEWKEFRELQETAMEQSSVTPPQLDARGNRIIYTHPNVLLQKWNHCTINYSGGTMDVFYNGALMKSAINVVPFMKHTTLSVGHENGCNGNISNMIYFKKPLDIMTIHTLYDSLKETNPPCNNNSDNKIIQLPDNMDGIMPSEIPNTI